MNSPRDSAAASRLTDTTSCVASEVPCSRRMMPSSSTTPMAGANTSRTSNAASTVGIPQSTCSCQYMKAPSIPMAPCAKLKMPVVVYVSTSPLAAMANTPAVHSPVIVRRRNFSTRSVGGDGLGQLDDVGVVAVELALVRLRVLLVVHELRPVERHQQEARRRRVRTGVRLGVQAATGPLVDLGVGEEAVDRQL